jgi:hypothetical protein
MQTWTELQDIVTEQLSDDSATTIRKARRDLNIAANRILAAMGRETTHLTVNASIVADQVWYQLPENCIRVAEAWIDDNGNKYPLTPIESEKKWNYLTSNATTSAVFAAQAYHVRGSDLIGIYPKPGRDITDGLVISFEPRQIAMQNEDYTTGTVAVVQGSPTVTGTGTAFTERMVGRAFRLDNDGEWYKIQTYVSPTSVTLENNYAGISDSGAFTIGEVPSIPAEYHDSLADYALFRAWQRRKDRANAGDFKALWDETLILIKEAYAGSTSSAVVSARPPTQVNDIFTNTPSAVV